MIRLPATETARPCPPGLTDRHGIPTARRGGYLRENPLRQPRRRGRFNLDFYDTLPIDDLIKNAVIMASFVYNAAMDDVKVPRKGRRP